MILKLTTFVAHFPLSVFLFFRGKHHLNQLSRLHASLCVICIIAAASLFLKLPRAEAAFMEQIAIDPVAVSLANTVTADPPGTASVHYNPAGLSLMGDGNFISQGIMPVYLHVTSQFNKDPNFEGFHDYLGNLEQDPVANTSGSNTGGKFYIPVIDVSPSWPIMPAPVTGLSHRNPGSDWTFGYAIYMPFGGGWDFGDTNDPSRYETKSVYMQHLIYFGPSISYRVNKTLSLGGSFGVGQTAMGMSTDFRAPNEITNVTKVLGDATQGMDNPIFDILGVPMPLFGGGLGPYADIGSLNLTMRDDFVPSYNLGALWEPYDWISFGLVYQSAIKAHMSGKYSWQYSQDFQNMTGWMGQNAIMQIVSMVFDLPYQSVSSQTGTVTMDMEWPQMASFGVKLKPVKRLSLMADLHWANWSCEKDYEITFDQKIQVLQLSKFMGYNGGPYTIIMEKNFKDTLNWSVGVEYQALDWLALRAGYENRVSSAAAEDFDALSLPTLDYYGVGLGIKGGFLGMFKDADVDLCFGYLISKPYEVADGSSVNLNSTVLGAGVNNPYTGLNFTTQTAIYIGGIKITEPLEIFTDGIYKTLDIFLPAKWQLHASPEPAKGSLNAAETGKSVDSSSTITNTLRPEGKSYYTEDSE
jgi:long-subunit fatty acid transport protein